MDDAFFASSALGGVFSFWLTLIYAYQSIFQKKILLEKILRTSIPALPNNKRQTLAELDLSPPKNGPLGSIRPMGR